MEANTVSKEGNPLRVAESSKSPIGPPKQSSLIS